MGDNEVFATGLADKPGVRAVVIDVLADRSPHALEHLGGPREMDARELLVSKDLLGDRLCAAAHHVDDAGWKAGLVEHFHEEVVDEQGLRRGLEDDRVAHERGRGRKVGGDRSEVERAHSEDEAFERPVFEAIPRGAVVERLLAQQLVGEERVVAPEIDGLTGRIDLRLVHRLRLAQHRGRVDRVAPWARQERGRPQQDRGTVVERGGCPPASRLERGRDGVVKILFASDGVFGYGQLVSMRRTDVCSR